MSRAVLMAGVAWLVLPTSLAAQTVLTLDDVITRARERSATVVVARASVAEAESALIAATPRFRENPTVDVRLGPRFGGARQTTDLDIGMAQSIEIGGQRGARMTAAQAGIARAHADVDEVARVVARDAALAFFAVLAAESRLRIAAEADGASRELLAATERRYAAGDISGIDLNLAKIDAARTAASLNAARTDQMTLLGVVRALTRIPIGEPLSLNGALDTLVLPPLERLRAALSMRPDLRVLQADASEALAQMALGRAAARPDISVRVGYLREERTSALLGGLTIGLPFTQRGQGAIAASAAKDSRARVALEVTRDVALMELTTAYDAYTQSAATAVAFTRETEAPVIDNLSLARRGYEAGELNLVDYLFIRRNALETRTLGIEHRLDAARRWVEVVFVSGGGQ